MVAVAEPPPWRSKPPPRPPPTPDDFMDDMLSVDRAKLRDRKRPLGETDVEFPELGEGMEGDEDQLGGDGDIDPLVAALEEIFNEDAVGRDLMEVVQAGRRMCGPGVRGGHSLLISTTQVSKYVQATSSRRAGCIDCRSALLGLKIEFGATLEPKQRMCMPSLTLAPTGL